MKALHRTLLIILIIMRTSIAMISFAKVACTFSFDTIAIICQIVINNTYALLNYNIYKWYMI